MYRPQEYVKFFNRVLLILYIVFNIIILFVLSHLSSLSDVIF